MVFDHASETPGLGAEIATPIFENQCIDKQLYSGTQLVGISVVKGTAGNNPHAVDAISGGTITSRAVETMIKNCLAGYDVFIQKQKGIALQSDSDTKEEVENEVNAEGHE